MKNTSNSEPIKLFRIPNGSFCAPAIGSLLIYNKTKEAPYGHVAIITGVEKDFIQVSEQNFDNEY